MDNFEVRPRTLESPPCSELLEALDSDVLLCFPESWSAVTLTPNPCMCACSGLLAGRQGLAYGSGRSMKPTRCLRLAFICIRNQPAHVCTCPACAPRTLSQQGVCAACAKRDALRDGTYAEAHRAEEHPDSDQAPVQGAAREGGGYVGRGHKRVCTGNHEIATQRCRSCNTTALSHLRGFEFRRT